MTNENQLPLIGFKIIWEERFREMNGFDEEEESSLKTKEITIYAQNEAEACDIWEKEFANEGTNGIESCSQFIEHPLLDQYIETIMPDGAKYRTPVKFIAKNRATHFASQFENNEFRSLAEDTIPFFHNDHSKIAVWATQNISWPEIRRASIKISPEPNLDEMQAAWLASWEDSKLLASEFTKQSLKSLSAAAITKVICDELPDDDLWSIRASELIRAAIPLIVKLQRNTYQAITPETIHTHMDLYGLTHEYTPETYQMHDSEFAQLLAPINAFLKKEYGYTPENMQALFSEKNQEIHSHIVQEVKKACLKANAKSLGE